MERPDSQKSSHVFENEFPSHAKIPWKFVCIIVVFRLIIPLHKMAD